MSEQWKYLTVEVKPGLMGGFESNAIQNVLERHGHLGWELVNVVIYSPFTPALVFFKMRD